MPFLSVVELKAYHDMFKKELQDFPEYLSTRSKSSPYVMGGFGALGNASSFHNPCVRMLRLRIMSTAVKLFNEFETVAKPSGPRNLAQLVDRMSVREIGSSVSPESWHRDQSTLKDPRTN